MEMKDLPDGERESAGNPYAPPLSAVGREVEPPVKRPASTKWAIVALLLNSGFLLAKLIQERDTYNTFVLMKTTAIVLLLAGIAMTRRSPWFYGVLVLFLAFYAFGTCWVVATGYQLHAEKTGGLRMGSELITGLFVCGLLVWLFGAVAFGRRSRVYYRVAKERGVSGSPP